MNLLLLSLVLLADLSLDLGDFEVGNSGSTVLWQGLHGVPTTPAEGAALGQALAAQLQAKRLRLTQASLVQPATDEIVQQQALELELLLGLDTQAFKRADGLLALHQQRASALLRHHHRACRLYYAAARAFEANARPQRLEAVLQRLAACEVGPLIKQSWSSKSLAKALLSQSRKGQAMLTLRGGPPGAQAFIAGLSLGALPVQVTGLPVGTHQVQILSGAGGFGFELRLVAGQRSVVEVPEQVSGMNGLGDVKLHPTDLNAFRAALTQARAVKGMVAFRSSRRGLTGLVYSKTRAAVVQADDPATLAAAMVAALGRLALVSDKGLRLAGLSASAGLPQKRFGELRSQAAQANLDDPPASLVEGMVAYAAKVLGKSPATLREKLAASGQHKAWLNASGSWVTLMGLDVAQKPALAVGGTLLALRVQPMASLNRCWWVAGVQLQLAGPGAEIAGAGWDPLDHPVDPITAAEPQLSERVHLLGHGLYGAQAVAGLAYGRAKGAWQLLLLAQAGWRQIEADLVHEQFVDGEPASTQVLRRTGAFAWGGQHLGASLLSLHQLRSWTVGLAAGWRRSEFPAVQLDLIIPGGNETLAVGVLFGRRF